MDIVVLVKRVPDTSEAELVVDHSGRDVRKEDLAFDINEWDSFAIEEAVLLKEQHGGTVTAITVGPEDSEEVLRHCIALGADHAIRIDDPALAGSDNYAVSKVLAAAVKRLPFDLVLSGMMASDDGDMQVGGNVAELLGVAHASQALGLEVDGMAVRVRRELEGGLEEKVDLLMPALITVQTGMNEPRYVPIAGIRRAARREVELLNISDLGLAPDEVGSSGARVELDSLFLPPESAKGEIIQGSVDSVVEQLAGIFASRGWLR